MDNVAVPAATQFLDQMVELDGEADAEHVIQAGMGQAEARGEADTHVSSACGRSSLAVQAGEETTMSEKLLLAHIWDGLNRVHYCRKES